MKKVVLKGILGYAVLLASFTSNAQVIVEENFQGFGNDGYILTAGAPKDNSTCAGQPDEKNLELKRTYASGTAVVYSLINSGVSSTCPVKGGSLTITKVGSVGYIELGKFSENTVSALPSSLTISKLPYVGTISFNASWTGGNRNASSQREGVLYKSADNTNWTVVDVTANDPEGKLTGFFGDVYGANYTAIIDGSYYIKFEGVADASGNRFRIHDLTIDATAVVSVKDLFVDGTASVSVNQKTVQVKSANNGLLEIVGMDGKVLHSNKIAAGAEESIQVNQSGMYAVRLIVGNNASVQKIVVQ